MKYNILCFIILTIITSSCKLSDGKTISLEGEWSVALDSDRDGTEEDTALKIALPGTLTEAGYGDPTTGSDFGILTPTHKYIGPAWYEREIEIPEEWAGKIIEIFLERVLWESKVFINGKERSVQDALGTPHIHKIGNLSPGKHQLAIRVNNDMIHNIGDKGHAYGEYTQSIWNGVVGRMEMQAKDPTHITHVRTFSMTETGQLKVEIDIEASDDLMADILLKIKELGRQLNLHEVHEKVNLIKGKNKKEVVLDLQGRLRKWSEFDPAVYILSARLKTDQSESKIETEFGYLKIDHDGTKILINDRPVFLRGNLDCVHFPLTGYPSTRVEDWERIFRIYKDYGLNHVRFHSWCPPEAAFKAANRLGIYIQAEASIWIDWWMSEDMVARGRPEMDTKGHPKGLGLDPARDEFVISEMNRVVDSLWKSPLL